MNLWQRRELLFLWIIVTVMTMTNCQAIKNQDAASKEQMLAAAGFQRKVAQTPEQLDDIQKMAQRKFVTQIKDGKLMYVYPDFAACRCVYVGTESNYQEYQKMAFQKDLADEQQATAAMNESAALNWGYWGGWGRWRY